MSNGGPTNAHKSFGHACSRRQTFSHVHLNSDASAPQPNANPGGSRRWKVEGTICMLETTATGNIALEVGIPFYQRVSIGISSRLSSREPLC